MKSRSYIFAIASLSVLLFTQCKKEKNEAPAPTNPTTPAATGPANLAELFVQNGVQVQSAQINASAGQNFTVGGAKVTIPSDAFVDASGTLVTGTVNVILKGVFTKKEIILSGAPANAQGRLIATKGCVKVSVSQNTQTLRVSPNANVFVDVPEPGITPLNNIKKFYATALSITDTSKVWKAGPDTNAISPVFNSTDQKYYYHARLDSAVWLNTGYAWDTVAPKTTVTVTLGNTFDATSGAVYISLNGSTTVGALYHLGQGVYSISNIPIGKNVVLVALGVKNGTYYYASSATVITANHSQTLTPQTSTLSAIESQLLLLP
ncbi:MAG: hypothetical protein K0S33_2802 [Bacteroidetes bacterium]|jgi:hypothetical protein|nr:hypothetical protein [Bacteroidota bacterium]